MKQFLIIDGNAYIHRAYHALPPLFTSKGEMVQAVYGFLRMLVKIIKTFKPEYLAVCFDHPSKTFRHIEFAGYKANRRETEEGLKTQIPAIREAVSSLGITAVEKEGYEADDIIATLARKNVADGMKIIIVTGDKDILQLVDKNINVLNEPKETLFTPEKVVEKYGVSPGQMVDVFSLSGDATDNVPGVHGIGEKTASKLIAEYGSVEELLKNIEKLPTAVSKKIKTGMENLLLSRNLIKLDDCVPVETDIERFTLQPGRVRSERFVSLLKDMEFNSLINEFIKSGIMPATKDNREYGCRTLAGEDELAAVIEEIRKSGMFSIVLRTTEKSPLKAEITGMAVSTGEGTAAYVPILTGFPVDRFSSVLQDPGIKKIGHNLKYIMLCLVKYGIEMKGAYFDTMVASYCLNPSRKNHVLKDVVFEYLGINIPESVGGTGGEDRQISMDAMATDGGAARGTSPEDGSCAAAGFVLRLHGVLKKELTGKNLNPLFETIEMPLLAVLADMELSGVKVDLQYLNLLSVEFKVEIERYERDIYSMAGKGFNINSPKQLSFILFDKLGLKSVKKTKTGYSTDEEVLRSLAGVHPLPEKIIEYRELQKLKSTYVDALIDMAQPQTGRVHTTFNQTVTATGRLSSTEPNLQNIPVRTQMGKKIRTAFIPEKGYVFLSADYSQIDLRVLAHISKDKSLMSAFSKGEDIHTATAMEIFGVPPEKIDEQLRRVAKTINFGIVYGMSAFGLAQQLGIPDEQARRYIDDYFKRYAGVRDWIDSTLDTVRKEGRVSTLMGRLRFIPEINSKNGAMRSFAERVAINTPVQGTSADIIKQAMINIHRRFASEKTRGRMLLQVHDELLFEVRERDAIEFGAAIKSEMETAVKLDVPVVVDIKTGMNWRDMQPADNSRGAQG